MSPPHKPRRKTKKTAHFDANVKPEAHVKPEALVRSPTFPLEGLLWPARSSLSQWEILPLILMAVGLFRWAAGLWGYSGSFNILVPVFSASSLADPGAVLQVSANLPCLATMKRRGTGWRSPPNSPSPNGTSTTSSGGGLTILLSQHTTAGSSDISAP